MYSTGSQTLDSLFGGYYNGTIHAFYGVTKAGKTTFSTYIPIGQIYKAALVERGGKLGDGEVFYIIDGDGGYDVERAKQIWRGMGIAELDDLTRRVRYFNPTDFAQQHKLITELPDMVKKENQTPLFVSADPVCAIYRGIVLRTEQRFKMVNIGSYTGKIDLQLTRLRELAVQFNIPTVISSWPGSQAAASMMDGRVGETPMIGGRALGFLPKLIVEIRIPKAGSSLREAYVYKHRSKPEGKSAFFRLVDSGIADVTDQEVETALQGE